MAESRKNVSRDLLISNAEAFAAGKTLGLSEKFILERIEVLRKSGKLNAMLDQERFRPETQKRRDKKARKLFEHMDAPTGRAVLRQAKKLAKDQGVVFEKLSETERAELIERVVLQVLNQDLKMGEFVKQGKILNADDDKLLDSRLATSID